MPSTTAAISGYFAAIANAIRTTLAGMGVTGRYLLSKPVTVQYPDEKDVVPQGYRGVHVLDASKCSACGLCKNACPVDCITIESIGKGKNAQITRWEVDYNRCLFCGLCVEPCATSAIRMGTSYDLSRYDSAGCSIDLAKHKHGDETNWSPTGDRVVPQTPPPAAPPTASQ